MVRKYILHSSFSIMESILRLASSSFSNGSIFIILLPKLINKFMQVLLVTQIENDNSIR